MRSREKYIGENRSHSTHKGCINTRGGHFVISIIIILSQNWSLGSHLLSALLAPPFLQVSDDPSASNNPLRPLGRYGLHPSIDSLFGLPSIHHHHFLLHLLFLQLDHNNFFLINALLK